MLSKAARKARILKDLKSTNLISIGQLADNGCQTSINEHKLEIKKQGKIILTGRRNCSDGLYDIPIFSSHPNPKSCIQDNNYKIPVIHNILPRLPQPTKYKKPQRTPKRYKLYTRNEYHINHISSNNMDTILQETK